MMSSIWYVICLISPGKNEEICLMFSIHSEVLMQRQTARNGLSVLAHSNLSAPSQLFGRILTVIELLIEKISHSQDFISLCPSPHLKSHFCVFKGELFFVSLSFQQRDGPFSISMGSGPSCRSCSLLAASRLSHPSSLLM